MSSKCNQSFIFSKRIIKYLLILGINTYVFNVSFGQTDPAAESFRETVLSKCKAVDSPDKQVGELDPNQAASLPIGIAKEINGRKYVICIDSAYFLETGAYFSAYMAIELPNADEPLAFAAKDIKFNPKGVQGGEQAKLMLVSHHTLELGPNTKLEIPGDGSNYVNWGCNGFESVNLHGKFVMSKSILEPVAPDTAVTAEFAVQVEDVQNMMMAVDFSPFTVKGMKDFEFTISQATVDMSDNSNPNVPMPQCYQEIYPDDINLWRGFHIQYFEVKLPEKLSAHNNSTEIYAQDLFIDEAGVTGFIGANNVLSLGEGETQGEWGFSIDNIEIGLTTNQLTSGKIEGDISIPALDNNSVEYLASISKNQQTNGLDYYFAASFSGPVSLSAFKSTLTLHETSVLSMTVSNNTFKPQLVLNGDWKLDTKGKFEGIAFQNVTLVTESPYLTQGQFSLVGSIEAKLGNFTISLNTLQLGIYNGLVGLGVGMSLNIGDSYGVAGGFRVLSEITRDENNKLKWKFDSFRVDSIAVHINTQAVKFDGGIYFMNDHPIYGNGFKGNLEISIKDVFAGIELSCIFGKVNGYRYFAIDAAVGVIIPIGNTGITLTQFSGGVSYHMIDTRTPQSIMDQAAGGAQTPDLSPTFLPDQNTGLGLRAGVQFVYASEKLLNGELVFSIQFNSNGGLQSILFAGAAYMLVTKSERANSNSYVKGVVAVGFDNQEKIFDMQMQASASLQDAISASIWSQLYISPNKWYFHLGTPSNPCYVNLLNFATANAYFMFGQDLPPMPPPPPQVTSVLGSYQSSRDDGQIAGGNGIGTGMNLQIGFDGAISVTTNWEAYASGYVGAGFDMTLYKYSSSAHCSGSSGPFGAKYWFLQGQLYAYGNMSAGARKKDGTKDVSIISASMAMLLQGKLPNPCYVYGAVALQASILGIFNLDVSCDFDAGTECTPVQ